MADDRGRKLADAMFGPAFGVFPQMKPKRSKQDPEAAKNVPIDLARGMVAGALGAPGDIESLIRMLPGLKEETILPTSEDVLKRIPGGSDTPASRAAAGAGTLLGGLYTGPGSGVRAVTAVPKAVAKAGKEFVEAAGQTVSPLTVYHGTPHKFEKFDASKIGTGEGAQAYGHGLYFAENPNIAKSYRITTTGKLHELTDVPSNKKWQKDLLDGVSTMMSREGITDPVVAIDKYAGHLEKIKEIYPGLNRNNKALELKKNWLLSQKETAKSQRAGSLYKVDLPDEQIAKMLDWDKPLSQQPEVQKALKGTDYEVGISEKEAEKIADVRLRQEAADWADETGGDPVDYINNANWERYVEQARKESGNVDSAITGKQLHDMILRDSGYNPKLADPYNYQVDTSETLRELGIPGIKYLDRTSRGAGEGTRNFVVFPGEEKSLTILERNPEGMAKGGRVQFSDNPDTMRLELTQGPKRYVSGGLVAEDLILEERPL